MQVKLKGADDMVSPCIRLFCSSSQASSVSLYYYSTVQAHRSFKKGPFFKADGETWHEAGRRGQGHRMNHQTRHACLTPRIE